MKKFALLLVLVAAAPMVSWAQRGTPIGNDIGTETLTDKKLQGIFLGDKSLWNNGNNVVVVLPSSNSSSFESLAKWALGSSGFEYQKHWLSLVFQGRINAPVFLKDEAEVIEYVANHPGAIGIIYSSTPPEGLQLSVK